MAISLHSVASKPGSRQRVKRLGRGPGSGRGKTSGKGTKGQRARTGGKSSLKLKGMKQMLLAFPKNRGFQSRFAKDLALRVSRLNVLAADVPVTLQVLQAAGLVRRSDRSAKVIAGGELTKALTIAAGVFVSKGAKAEIERAGGKVA
ncbi:50S ribosomal protein L15 [Patescibacteria group bacterium]|nr:50S ribosomal protein L15 [Patescibacteria group bacterium]MBP9710174.1 50S ribosomal protein L15 [Patescibacteria group bacterium]